MDNVPDNKTLRKIHFVSCFLLRKFLWSEVGCRTEKNRAIRLLYSIMRFVPRKILINWYEVLVKINSYHRTEMVRILTFPTPKGKYGFYRKWFLKQSRYQFGTITLTGARDYEGYLSHKFGNYMELPPEEQRKIHPVSKLELIKVEL